MNIRKGLFRLWCVAAPIWIVAVTIYQYSAILHAKQVRVVTVWDAIGALGWIVLPPIIALIVIPAASWICRGFAKSN